MKRSYAQVASSTLSVVLLLASGAVQAVRAQRLFSRESDSVSPEIEKMYERGLAWLVKNQQNDGQWTGSHGADPGVVGLGVLAMLAHGEDPDYGLYSGPIRKGLDYILKSADANTGYIGSSMYNHGFATLALAEAYGMTQDQRLGKALEKAVGLILAAQTENPTGAWRYSPTSRDADTTVSGAVLVGLFAARNAGVGVPDAAVDRALDFYRRCQGGDGGFGYTGAGGSNMARTAIGTLVLALGRQTDSAEFKAALRYLRQRLFLMEANYPYYYLYYASQALFQGSTEAWEEWNAFNVRSLQTMQNPDGSWAGPHGAVFSTAAALLSLAVNYRFLPIYER
ncbi:MAG: terpene cyclase/mutase family protein [Kiritimatiellae bacterium]|nr:terpene cyclase/mutase family protein [Kiritimatiellia bacterium]